MEVTRRDALKQIGAASIAGAGIVVAQEEVKAKEVKAEESKSSYTIWLRDERSLSRCLLDVGQIVGIHEDPCFKNVIRLFLDNGQYLFVKASGVDEVVAKMEKAISSFGSWKNRYIEFMVFS